MDVECSTRQNVAAANLDCLAKLNCLNKCKLMASLYSTQYTRFRTHVALSNYRQSIEKTVKGESKQYHNLILILSLTPQQRTDAIQKTEETITRQGKVAWSLTEPSLRRFNYLADGVFDALEEELDDWFVKQCTLCGDWEDKSATVANAAFSTSDHYVWLSKNISAKQKGIYKKGRFIPSCPGPHIIWGASGQAHRSRTCCLLKTIKDYSLQIDGDMFMLRTMWVSGDREVIPENCNPKGVFVAIRL